MTTSVSVKLRYTESSSTIGVSSAFEVASYLLIYLITLALFVTKWKLTCRFITTFYGFFKTCNIIQSTPRLLLLKTESFFTYLQIIAIDPSLNNGGSVTENARVNKGVISGL